MSEIERHVQGAPLIRVPVAPVELLVCTTCRQATPEQGAALEGGACAGEALITRLVAGVLPEGIALQGVACLSNCGRGCTVALRGRGRWTYVWGELGPGDTALVLEAAARHRDAADGLVPWRERPAHFRKNTIARVPPAVEG